MSGRGLHSARWASWPAAIALLLAASAAAAQDDTPNDESTVATVEARFWGFSSNPQFFAYSTTNHLGDSVFFVGQAGAPDPVYQEVATEEQSARDILIRRDVRDRYGWASSGTDGASSPSGYWTVSVMDAGANLSVTAAHAPGPASPIGTIARMPDQSGRAYATFEVKQALWSDDELVVVIVLHQALSGDWPVEVDTVYGFQVPPRPEAPAPTPAPAPAEPAPAPSGG